MFEIWNSAIDVHYTERNTFFLEKENTGFRENSENFFQLRSRSTAIELKMKLSITEPGSRTHPGESCKIKRNKTRNVEGAEDEGKNEIAFYPSYSIPHTQKKIFAVNQGSHPKVSMFLKCNRHSHCRVQGLWNNKIVLRFPIIHSPLFEEQQANYGLLQPIQKFITSKESKDNNLQIFQRIYLSTSNIVLI